MAAEEKRAPEGLVDERDRSTPELVCTKCGQDLRARSLGADCPACGHPILDSLFGEHLAGQPGTTALRLADALRVVVYGVAILGVLIGLGVLRALIVAPGLLPGVEQAFDLLFAGALILPLPVIVGVALLMPRRPAAYYKIRYLNPRRLRRWALIALPLVLAVVVCGLYARHVLLPLAAVLWAIVPPAVLLRRIERLMCELPSFKLARYAFAVMIGAVLFGIACFGVKLLRIACTTDAEYEGAMVGVTIMTLVAAVALAVAGLNLLLRAQWALAEQGR